MFILCHECGEPRECNADDLCTDCTGQIMAMLRTTWAAKAIATDAEYVALEHAEAAWEDRHRTAAT